MNPSLTDGQAAISQAGAHPHRSAGDEPMLRQDQVSPGKQVLLALSHEREPLPKRCTGRLVVVIDDVRIGKNQAGLGMGCELSFRTLKPNWIPDVVLVRERNQI